MVNHIHRNGQVFPAGPDHRGEKISQVSTVIVPDPAADDEIAHHRPPPPKGDSVKLKQMSLRKKVGDRDLQNSISRSTQPHEAGKSGTVEHFATAMGPSRNYFFRTHDVSAQIVTYREPDARLLMCFPQGNSGIELSCPLTHEENRGLALELSEAPRPVSGKDGQRGVLVAVSANKSKLVIDHVQLDTIRLLRDESSPPELEERLRSRRLYAERNPGRLPGDRKDVHMTRDEKGTLLEICGKTPGGERKYVMKLILPPAVQASRTDGGAIILQSTDGSPLSFSLEGTTDFEPLTPLFAREILDDKSEAYRQKLEEKAASPAGTQEDKTKAARYGECLRNLSFLSYREKFLAGGWRYLTYFGRDTILSLMMLRSSVRPEVYESGMRSVLDRLSPEGRVAHEEDIGSQAADHRMRRYNELFEAGKGDEAERMAAHPLSDVYDYKMVDDDFLFPVMMGMYMEDPAVSAQQKKEFLSRVGASGETNLAAALRNWNFVLGKGGQYHQLCRRRGASSPESVEGLIRIQEGQYAGDWRDSNNGLGGGVIPGSVNIDLVANSLTSIDRMVTSGILDLEEMKALAEEKGLQDVSSLLSLYTSTLKNKRMESIIRSWEKAKDHFRITLSADEIREKVTVYLNEHPMSAGERHMLLSTVIEEGCTVRDFLEMGKTPESLQDGLTYYALSLDREGKPVPVMSSDACFRLMTGEPSPGEIEHILKLITLPYPLGLASDVGMFVANPVYSGDKKLWKILDKDGYHGTVVWSWQNAMMEKGLMKQIQRFSSGEYRDNARARALVEKMNAALKAMRETELSLGDMVNFELWTYRVSEEKMKPQPYGQEGTCETESNAIQLWSTVGLSVMEDCDRTRELLGETAEFQSLDVSPAAGQ